MKRYLTYFALSLIVMAGATTPWLGRLWGSACEWFFLCKLERVLGAEVKFESVKGGLLQQFQAQSIRLFWPGLFPISSVEAAQAGADLSIKSLFQKEITQSVFLDSILVCPKKGFHERVLNSFCSRTGIKHGVLAGFLQREMIEKSPSIYINALAIQRSRDESGREKLSFLAYAPDTGFRNRVLVQHEPGRIRLVLSDVSCRYVAELLGLPRIGAGRLDAQVILEDAGVRYAEATLKDVMIKTAQGDAGCVNADLVYENGVLTFRDFSWKSRNLFITVAGAVANVLHNPQLDLMTALCLYENGIEPAGIILTRLKGALSSPVSVGSFRDLTSQEGFSALHWRAGVGKILFANGRARMKDIEADLVVPGLNVPVHADLDALINSRMIRIRNGFLSMGAGLPAITSIEGGVSLIGRSPEIALEGVVTALRKEFRILSHYQCGMLKADISTAVQKSGVTQTGAQIILNLSEKMLVVREAHWDSAFQGSGELRFIPAGATSGAGLSGRFDISRYRVGPITVSGRVETNVTWEGTGRGVRAMAAIDVKDLHVNEVPAWDARGFITFDTARRVLTVTQARFSDAILWDGIWDAAQKTLDFTWKLKGADISAFSFLFPPEKRREVSGLVWGLMTLKGAARFPQFRGRLDVRDGQILKLKFDQAYFHFDGLGPVVQLHDSSIMNASGKWTLAGKVDLSDPKPFREVRFSMDPERMYMHGLKIKNNDEKGELTLQKDIGKGWAVSVKARSALDEAVVPDTDSDAQFQLQYDFRRDEGVLFRMDENEHMIGVRKKFEF